MDLYTNVAYENSRHLTLRYSTSFGLSSRLFGKHIKPHIYAIYGLVRVADEIVDTYKGDDAEQLLNTLENEVYAAIKSGYSTNPIVHAFAQTARSYGIEKKLIAPFFKSMHMDLKPLTYSHKKYEVYIHGSAEVIGLMCLKVFTLGNLSQYKELEAGAVALGSAYQKVNFLRDIAADYRELGRVYFPEVVFENFDETEKQRIIDEIHQEFNQARVAIDKLPRSSRKATLLSFAYYNDLLGKLSSTPAETLKTTRIRVGSLKKSLLIAKVLLTGGVSR